MIPKNPKKKKSKKQSRTHKRSKSRDDTRSSLIPKNKQRPKEKLPKDEAGSHSLIKFSDDSPSSSSKAKAKFKTGSSRRHSMIFRSRETVDAKKPQAVARRNQLRRSTTPESIACHGSDMNVTKRARSISSVGERNCNSIKRMSPSKHSSSLPNNSSRPSLAEERPPNQIGNSLLTWGKGFRINIGSKEYSTVDHPAHELIGQNSLRPWYSEYFANNPHENYYGIDARIGPIIVSVRRPDGDDSSFKVLVRTKKQDLFKEMDKLSMKRSTQSVIMGKKVSIYDLLHRVGKIFANVTKGLKQSKSPQVRDALVNFEKKLSVVGYKFGVLFCKDGQSTEEEMFGNRHGSEEFDRFLNFLGEKIPLKGWPHYRAGLDVSDDVSTGEYSIYRKWGEYEVMFHVSTLLPYNPLDIQQVGRKRHLGNDIAVIIFKDGKRPFNPSSITSEFNHVFAIVSEDKRRRRKSGSRKNSVKRRRKKKANHANDLKKKAHHQNHKNKEKNKDKNNKEKDSDKDGDKEEDTLRYRFAISRKVGVPDFGPLFSQKGYRSDDRFRDFLFHKLINAERASYKSPAFAQKISRVRNELLRDLINDYCK
eukprot:TRINITY_DN3582_c0_g1_i1.p1 TRINITY_DN3582_c0_g1~~TRINITY_DN3582_c0_g1_i1.p1  ORF type:complete len:590 (-),score=88.28 TRINITY_DN3582_c0_g1_i1:100-1869(-)